MKTAIVTGGGRGIGRAICLALAKSGTNLVVNYAGNQAAALETVAACEALGVQAIAVQGDVAVAADCKAVVERCLAAFGRVDILVNNAGITRDNLLLRMPEADFDAVLDTNCKGTFLMMQAVSRPMMKQRFGRIVNLSSVVGMMGNAGQVNYAASKAGVIGMTKSVARELASRGITANAIAPGFIETDMTAVLSPETVQAAAAGIPLGRMGAPEEVAAAVVFLTGDAAGYITGQVLAVDGGMAM